jgi:hypothetical protein
MEKCKDCDGPKVIHNRIDDIEKTVEGHDTTLYGKNQDGITYKQKECITKKNLWAFFAATLFIFAGIFTVVNTMWADTRDYPETKKQVKENTMDIVALKAKQDAIYNLLVSVDRKLDKKEESKKVDPAKDQE